MSETVTYETRTFLLTRADLLAYAEASGDHNPIHSSDEIALAVGLPGVIAHGMLTLGLVASAVEGWAAANHDHAEVVEIGARFTAPVVVPKEGAAQVTVAVKSVKETEAEDGPEVTLMLEVTTGGEKVLAAPKAVLRPRRLGQ